jgi:ATP-dependent Lon protease
MPASNIKTTPKNKTGSKTKSGEKVLGKRRAGVDPDPSDSDSDFIDEDQEDAEMDSVEYHKFLAKMFPSKHATEKAKAGTKLKKLLLEDVEEEDVEEEDDEEEEVAPKKNKSKKGKSTISPKNKSKRHKMVIESESESDEEEEEMVEKGKKKKGKGGSLTRASSGNKLNIIFAVGGGKNGMYADDDEDYDEEYDDDYEDEDEEDDESSEDEDESVSSVSDSSDEDSDEDSDDEEEEESEYEDESEEEAKEVITRSKSRGGGKFVRNRVIKTNPVVETESETETKAEVKTKKTGSSKSNDAVMFDAITKLRADNPGSKLLHESMEMGLDHYQSKLEKSDRQSVRKAEKQKEKNDRIFKKLLRDKNSGNDYTFFSKLEQDVQVKLIKEAREVNKISQIDAPYRISILQSEIPHVFKSIALKKLNALKYMEPGSGEFYKIKNWVDAFMRIPFNSYRTLPVTITDGVDKCHEFMANAQKTLDDAVYGLDDAKMQIMQMLGQLVTNPQAIGTAIAIKGPMGTGKTSLVREGISKILDRPFAFIALGGATDASFLEGHSYTYEGSIWGKIVQIILDSKCMNPVIYFDELDKISDTPKGEEIAGILTHLTDTAQNNQFHDKYFSDIDFDLSKCLFIFSYNDESKVNPILRDRMYRIQTKGYDAKQKTIISNNYVIPKIREQILFKEEDIVIPDATIHHMIEKYCDKEDGIRNLKRCLEVIYTKLNLCRLTKPGSNLFTKDMPTDVVFPFTITTEVVDKMIKCEDKAWTAQGMYV